MMPPAETASRLESVGRCVPCGDILVMDDEGREVPPGREGEIWLRGPMVVKGYWDDPEATAASFVAGFWRSGDIGSLDEAGYLRVFDRKKDMINRGGYKIYTIEVENVLMSHPEIAEAAVIARPCPVLGERAHAVVCLKREGATRESWPRIAPFRLPIQGARYLQLPARPAPAQRQRQGHETQVAGRSAGQGRRSPIGRSGTILI